ncbi:hypothetical protein GCM10010869_48520 [Mesorhizobium tianshanense]|nr:hypothetical protein GCM10010869_48520 [Mesorhizobium tianshanense]
MPHCNMTMGKLRRGDERVLMRLRELASKTGTKGSSPTLTQSCGRPRAERLWKRGKRSIWS